MTCGKMDKLKILSNDPLRNNENVYETKLIGLESMAEEYVSLAKKIRLVPENSLENEFNSIGFVRCTVYDPPRKSKG